MSRGIQLVPNTACQTGLIDLQPCLGNIHIVSYVDYQRVCIQALALVVSRLGWGVLSIEHLLASTQRTTRSTRVLCGGSEQAFPQNHLSSRCPMLCLVLPPCEGLDCQLQTLNSGIGEENRKRNFPLCTTNTPAQIVSLEIGKER